MTKIDTLIQQVITDGRTTLTEAESKTVLKAYRAPVIEEWVVKTPAEAVRQAEQTGYPIVLKGLGAKLTHKTERGLVKLNLGSAAAVHQAAFEIEKGAGPDLEGYLVQPQVTGRREFVAGLFRDAQFGPVVMFGLGGIFTEALDDVVFRLAPFDEGMALQMITELHAKKLLEAFRGEQPADPDALARTLAGLSRLAVDHPEVREVDINPLLVGPNGRVTAVDALIVLQSEKTEEQTFSPPVAPQDVAKVFYPRSIAFLGASGTISKWGYLMAVAVLAGGYEGPVYLVNPRGGRIAGRPVYPSLGDIPGPVDLVVVTVPAEAVIALLPELKAKCVKSMLLVTSGFGETGPEGKELERKLVAAAHQAGVLILGPNTMGICNPHAKFFCTGMHAR
ncbi:MAG: acetate--CoA ligase family protein, partial [Syntrophales bacterium]|nr:acetate--CoA ligase family protein [Syntrophales bacterium]